MSLYRRPNSPFWWSKLYVDGKPVAFSTRERTKVRALVVERDKAKELRQRRALEGRYSLATVAAAWLEYKEANGRADLTVLTFKRIFKARIRDYFGAETDVRSITRAQLEEYKASRLGKAMANTIGQELTVIRQILRYAAEVLHIIETAPTTRNPPHRYEPKWRLLTAEEVGSILRELARLSAADHRAREALPWALLIANTGLRMGRSGELAQLTWEMVDLEKREIHLPGKVTKTKRARVVPLNAGALEALAMVHRKGAVGRVFCDRQHYQSWHRACRDAGVGHVRPYDLRHTFASMMHANGRPPVEVRDILGHVTWSMVNHYAHSYRDKLHEAAASVTVRVTLPGQNVTEKGANGQIGKRAGKGGSRREMRGSVG